MILSGVFLKNPFYAFALMLLLVDFSFRFSEISFLERAWFVGVGAGVLVSVKLLINLLGRSFAKKKE